MENFPVVVEFPLRWGEIDALGHVNNTVYFQWFESARIAFFGRTEFPTTLADHVSPILAQTECEFLRPVTFPSDVSIGTRVSRVGNTSLTMEYLVQLADGTDVARGKAVVVLVDTRIGKPQPLPDSVKTAVAALDH
jgi:acyl-CoA thioester hydrolase